MAALHNLKTQFISAEVDLVSGAVVAVRGNSGEIVSMLRPAIHGETMKLAFTQLAELPEGGPWLPAPKVPANQALALRTTADALTVTRIILVHERSVYVIDQLANGGAGELELLYGQRVEFSAKLLNEKSRLDVAATGYFDAKDDPPLRLRWPSAADGSDLSVLPKGAARELYITDLTEGRCSLHGAAKVEVAWNAELLPYLWLNSGGPGGLVLTPATGMPNALEEGHGLLRLAAGQVENVGVQVTLS